MALLLDVPENQNTPDKFGTMRDGLANKDLFKQSPCRDEHGIQGCPCRAFADRDSGIAVTTACADPELLIVK
jgi:hypothetical protein